MIICVFFFKVLFFIFKDACINTDPPKVANFSDTISPSILYEIYSEDYKERQEKVSSKFLNSILKTRIGFFFWLLDKFENEKIDCTQNASRETAISS